MRIRSTLIQYVALWCILFITSAKAQSLFRPADFSGLIVGKSSITQAQVKLGPPKDLFKDNFGTTWVYYDDLGPVPGKVELIVNSKTAIIESVTISPTSLTIDAAKKIFGPEFRLAKFDFDECLAKGGSAPIYEDVNGALEYVLYERLGIAMKYDAQMSVTSIEYLSKPLGPTTSQCQAKGRTSKK